LDLDPENQTTSTTGASSDELFSMQLQLLELHRARRNRHRDRDRERSLLTLGYNNTPTPAPVPLLPMTTSSTSSRAPRLLSMMSSTHLRLALMDRELGPNDYDMLLRLDEENKQRQQFLQNLTGMPLTGGFSKDQINRLPTFVVPLPPAPSSTSSSSSSSSLLSDTDQKKNTKMTEEDVLKKSLSSSMLISSTAENCAVCLEPKLPGEVLRTVPCCHTFHAPCIDPWLQSHKTCPVCKMDFSSLSI